MSSTELHTGKLIPTGLTKKDVEDLFKQSEEYNKGWEFNDWYFSEQYLFIHEDIVYKVQDTEHDDSDYLITGTKNEKGEIEYISQFYNGGCGFMETLEYVVEKANGKT